MQRGIYGATGHTNAYVTQFTCSVCFTEKDAFCGKSCCSELVCNDCVLKIVRTKVNDGIVHIPCPNPECEKALNDEDIVALIRTDAELKDKYDRFALNFHKGGSKKTCPGCCLITEHKLPRRFRLKEEDVKLRCASCDLEWCFKCHAPWHAGLTCKAFKTGEKQFHDWTKGTRQSGDANCQKCPVCRVYIQRTTGCDHMTCNRCDSEFCYKCGGLYIDILGIGDHHDAMSVLGCVHSYNGSSAKRRAVRGGYLAAKIAALTGYPFLFVGGAVFLLVFGILVVPVYVGYRICIYCVNTRRK